MQKFSKADKPELVKLLQSLPIHDADFKQIQYDKSNKRLNIILYNCIDEMKINIIFDEVCFFLSTDLDFWSNNQTISIFLVEENEDFIKPFLEKIHLKIINQLYFVFEAFSGNQIHIISSTISISTNKKDNTGDGQSEDGTIFD